MADVFVHGKHAAAYKREAALFAKFVPSSSPPSQLPKGRGSVLISNPMSTIYLARF